MGILIAIDGVDASGKQTQTELLKKRLENNELKIKSVSFPAYDNPSSTLVKMYLNGEFGDKPSDVNAYATSTFFAADRFATYKTDWGKCRWFSYRHIVFDYGTPFVYYMLFSNKIHQIK